MRFKAFALVAVSLAVPIGPLLAEGLACPPGARPLIKQLGYGQSAIPGIPFSSDYRDAILICNQGTVLSARLGGRPGSKLPESATIQRGTAAPAAMDELRTAMVNARVGFHEDCRFYGTHGVTVGSRIEWFGAGRRVHSFDLTPEVGELPPCDIPAILLYEVIGTVEDSARHSADHEQVDLP